MHQLQPTLSVKPGTVVESGQVDIPARKASDLPQDGQANSEPRGPPNAHRPFPWRPLEGELLSVRPPVAWYSQGPEASHSPVPTGGRSSSHVSWPAHHCPRPACQDISATLAPSHTGCPRAVNTGGCAGKLAVTQSDEQLQSVLCLNQARPWRAAWGGPGEGQGTDDGERDTGGFKQADGALRGFMPGV